MCLFEGSGAHLYLHVLTHSFPRRRSADLEGLGHAFERAGYRQWGTRVQDDLIDGVRWAIAQGHADPARICSYGASFGAYSAMMVAARAPDLIHCAAGLSGLYDLEAFATDSDTAPTAYGRSDISRDLRKLGRPPGGEREGPHVEISGVA